MSREKSGQDKLQAFFKVTVDKDKGYSAEGYEQKSIGEVEKYLASHKTDDNGVLTRKRGSAESKELTDSLQTDGQKTIIYFPGAGVGHLSKMGKVNKVNATAKAQGVDPSEVDLDKVKPAGNSEKDVAIGAGAVINALGGNVPDNTNVFTAVYNQPALATNDALAYRDSGTVSMEAKEHADAIFGPILDKADEDINKVVKSCSDLTIVTNSQGSVHAKQVSQAAQELMFEQGYFPDDITKALNSVVVVNAASVPLEQSKAGQFSTVSFNINGDGVASKFGSSGLEIPDASQGTVVRQSGENLFTPKGKGKDIDIFSKPRELSDEEKDAYVKSLGAGVSVGLQKGALGNNISPAFSNAEGVANDDVYARYQEVVVAAVNREKGGVAQLGLDEKFFATSASSEQKSISGDLHASEINTTQGGVAEKVTGIPSLAAGYNKPSVNRAREALEKGRQSPIERIEGRKQEGPACIVM